MVRIAHKFWFWALLQGCIVAAIAGWRFYIGVSEYLVHPSDGDLYAHTWSFQAVVFSIFTLPKIVLGVIGLLAVEWFVARMILKRQVIDGKTSA